MSGIIGACSKAFNENEFSLATKKNNGIVEWIKLTISNLTEIKAFRQLILFR